MEPLDNTVEPLLKDTSQMRTHLSNKDTLKGPKLTQTITFFPLKRGHLSNKDTFLSLQWYSGGFTVNNIEKHITSAYTEWTPLNGQT